MTAPHPLVSVLTPAYDAMPYVRRCVGSVLHQSLGAGAVEMIVVDDGSTDGTGEELDRLARRHPQLLRVLHQDNSGGPSGPRNTALGLARGRYVFFLDADDYLGVRALERLTAAAEEWGSDVVLGRMKDVGRRVPRSMFRTNQPDADLFASRVYWSLSAQKLFRRELLERLGLRFDTALRVGEDQPFTATAYLRARRISVVADYDCYYLVRRPDGQHLTLVNRTRPTLDALERVCSLLRAELPRGAGRDLLLSRHFEVELAGAFRFLATEREALVREREFARMRRLVTGHRDDGFWPRLPPLQRLRCHLAHHGCLEELLELAHAAEDHMPFRIRLHGDRALAHYPGPPAAVSRAPAARFDVTEHLSPAHHISAFSLTGTRLHVAGRVRLPYTDEAGSPATEVFLRHRSAGARECHAVVRQEDGGFTADWDLHGTAAGTPLADGFWDLYVRVRLGGLVKTVRLGNRRDPRAGTCPVTRLASDGRGGLRAAKLYATAFGNLSLRLETGARALREALWCETDAADWCGQVLHVSGRTNLTAPPPGAVTLRLAGAGHHDFPATALADGRFDAEIPVDALPPGRWRAALRIAAANLDCVRPLPRPAGLEAARWGGRLRTRYARPLDEPQLTLRIDRVRLLRGARHRLPGSARR
ncbi:glycosyltransferase family 2 protein [Streptomyces sp. enrichment culture]|uniref:glycosyltransferase family 2 protein n=1 Tax=Streptomyces sp. enrichment culture TaxID=1795815 RepID=UPI003F546C09